MDYAKLEEARKFFAEEKDSMLLLSLYGDYCKDVERYSYFERNDNLRESAHLNMVAIRLVLRDRLRKEE